MHMHEFVAASRPLYLETDASGVGLGAGLLQVRCGMNCEHGEIADNTILCPVVFNSKIY